MSLVASELELLEKLHAQLKRQADAGRNVVRAYVICNCACKGAWILQ